MEFHVIRTDITTELQLVLGAIEKKATMPILANVFIIADGDQLILKATDLEVGIITTCPAQIMEPGECTLNAKQLFDMLNAFSGNQVQFFQGSESLLDIVCEHARFSVETMHPLDYPSMPEYNFNYAMTFNNSFFRHCLKRSMFSMSNDSHKYALNGALFKIDGSDLCIVSTDGHRMSVIEKGLDEDHGSVDVILPKKGLLELKRSLEADDPDEDFQMGFSEGRVFFKVGLRVLFSRLIDGKFPDYTKAIPVNNDCRFELQRVPFQNILRRKTVLSSDKSKLVRLTFKTGELRVILKNAERGESVDKLNVEYEGDQLDLGFNVDYLHDFIKNIDVDLINMYVKDANSQGLFKIPEDRFGINYLHVVMPMRLG